MEDVQKKLLTKSKRAKMEQRGKFISFLCIALIVAVVVSIFYFVASKGLATFFKDKINVFDFLFGTNWNPSDIGADGKPMVGALPMIAGSFIVTFFVSDCCDAICDWSGCFYDRNFTKKRSEIFTTSY